MSERIDRANDANDYLNEWSIRNDLDELSENISPDIQLSEIWEHKSDWTFEINEDIKWKDNKWKFIEIRWKKYYENLWNERWLWYTISRDIVSNTDIVYIWNKNWNLNDGYWIEYFSDGRKYKGEREDGAKNWHGFEVLNWATFEWEYENWWPKYWVYKRFKNWELFCTYEWTIDVNRKYQNKWILSYNDWAAYDWEWKDWKFNWQGTYTYSDWSIYEGERKDWEKNWKWILTYASWTVYEGERKDWKRNWKWILTYASWTIYEGERKDWEKNWKWKEKFSNWDIYEWLYIKWKRFYDAFNEQQQNYVIGWDNPTEEIEWYWKYTHSNWKIHEYRVNNWTLTEESNSFISMYGDNKPNEDRWAKRWKLMYCKRQESENKINYSLKSWWIWPTFWELNWWNYQFKSKNWNILSIPKTTEFGENWSMHAANIINFCMDNARINWTYEFDYKGDTLQAKQSSPRWANTLVGNSGWSMVTWNALTTRYDENAVDLLKKYIWDTDILENIPKHFWWISAEELANWLNSCL